MDALHIFSLCSKVLFFFLLFFIFNFSRDRLSFVPFFSIPLLVLGPHVFFFFFFFFFFFDPFVLLWSLFFFFFFFFFFLLFIICILLNPVPRAMEKEAGR